MVVNDGELGEVKVSINVEQQQKQQSQGAKKKKGNKKKGPAATAAKRAEKGNGNWNHFGTISMYNL